VNWSGGDFQPGEEYRAAIRLLNIVGSGASLLVLITIVIMAVKP
jgi:hypothetical protein